MASHEVTARSAGTHIALHMAMAIRDRSRRAEAVVAPERESGIEVRGTFDNVRAISRSHESSASRESARDSEASRNFASLGVRFARNGEMNAELLQLESAMDGLAEHGITDVVRYVHRFTESARAVEHALSLALRTSLNLITKHRAVLPAALSECIDTTHTYIFDIAEYIAELMQLQTNDRSDWGNPGRFLPAYSSLYVSRKIEPAIEAVYIACDGLVRLPYVDGRTSAAAPLLTALDLLYEAVVTLDAQLCSRTSR
jgi:hypothetical protein